MRKIKKQKDLNIQKVFDSNMLSKTLRRLALVVEDDELIQDLIKRYLSSLGVEIIPAYNGIEAVKKYEELMRIGRKPDIVIMDIGLPFKNGIEATREIMSIDPDANIYGFTAFYGTERAKRLREAGAKKVIPRSVGFETFANIIREALMEKITV